MMMTVFLVEAVALTVLGLAEVRLAEGFPEEAERQGPGEEQLI